MGLCASKVEGGDELQRAKSKDVDRAIASSKREELDYVKLLLLGAGESGKSTLFKQMKTIYGQGFPEEERKTYRNIVFQNVMSAAVVLSAQVDERKMTPDLSAKGRAAKQYIEELPTEVVMGEEKLTSETAAHVKALWTDPVVQKLYTLRSTFQLDDSAKYYLDQIDTIAHPDYIPTTDDVIRSRVRTTGIVENTFIIEKTKFKMMDVGGQRNERKKWIHCFENVTAIIFVGAISEYDQVLYEDDVTNRMHEALTLFDSICNSKWFVKTSMILFLNKSDLFREKIKTKPITSAFPDYTGDATDFDQCVEYIQMQFEQLNKNPEKVIYSHVTCATDTDNVRKVFDAVKDIVIRDSLKEAGLH